jgi:hypothetical protein
LAVLTLTLIAAACAAFFTGWQAWISRDQEHRALRAYVLLQAELKPGSKNDPQTPYWVEFTATNIGTTPVYYFEITDLTLIKEEYEGYGPGNELEQSIAGRRCDFTEHDPLSGTFAKTYTRHTGIVAQTTQEQLAKFAAGEASIVSFGTACYWDIFRNPHRIHFCFRWLDVATSPFPCLEQNEEEYPD